MNTVYRRMVASAVTCVTALAPIISHAQYPDRPLRLVVPYTAGGPASLLARFLGPKLQQSVGQPVVIENRPGAGLNVGAQYVASATPDGHTLLLAASSMLVPTSFGGRTPAENLKAFAPVSLVGGFPLVLVSHAQLEVQNVKELIAYARARPGQVNYASSGNGSLTHLAGALFGQLAGVNMLHVPYRGINEALIDVAAGRAQIAFAGAPTTLPLVAGGRIRALAVTSLQRTSAAPQLPTIAEVLPGYEVMPWYGIVVPAATPRPVVMRLHREVSTLMQSAEVRDQWKQWGADPIYSKSPEEFAAMMQKEAAKWAAFVKQSGIKLD